MTTGLLVNPINNIMVFLREKYTILTNDVWRVAVDLVISSYEPFISTIRGDFVSKQERIYLYFRTKAEWEFVEQFAIQTIEFSTITT